jgi:hypothetical protein
VPGGYVIREANGRALVHISPATTRTKPGRRRCSRKTRRIAFNVARLPGLLGEADEDRKLKADQAERLGKKLTVHVG